MPETPALDEVKKRAREELQRPDFGVRVIIVWKVIKGLLLLTIAVTAFFLRDHDLHQVGVDVVSWMGIDPAGPRVGKALGRLTGLRPLHVGIGALLVGLVMFLEAWGLHRRRTWAEWLTVIVTSSLIPLEIYHLAHHPSLGKVLTLIANVAIVIYLLRHRWLFVPGRIGAWWKRLWSRGTGSGPQP